MDKKDRPNYIINPDQKLGQNFLESDEVLRKEVNEAQIKGEDIVLEIGPGTGNLTRYLVKHAKKVIAIEKDARFKRCMIDLKADNLDLIWADATKIKFPKFDKVVANLPYKTALPLIFKILESEFHSGVLICQKKMAIRLVAKKGETGYSRLSVQTQRVADIEYLETIPPAAFNPLPKVDSAMIKIVKKEPMVKIISESHFSDCLRFLFKYREDHLKAVLLRLDIKERDSLSKTLDSCLDKKITDLSIEEFGLITRLLYEKRVDVPRTSRSAFSRLVLCIKRLFSKLSG